ncbi:GNAT family N-acetyltransferase [Streptomyces sp. JJ36]|uniref:GNAT family N-acetyltransferase n=1 Tax=Streptomyces sp. JJ36 TaxID=2736645 RepID=UPI001EFF74A1|nr:GNAT family N-acetyltransferase [Streptomyces sp. JJ36]
MTPASPADLPIRPLSPYDLPACLDLATARGWTREEHKWRLLLTAGQGYGIDAPDRPHALIGAFVLTPYGSTDPAAPGGGTAYTSVGMVLVAERFQRRGLGLRLMEHALAASGDAVPFLTATPQGRPLYEKLGFKPVGRLGILTGHFTPPPGAAAPGGARVGAATVRPATAADLRDVLALDAQAFGADRTELLARLPAFADRFVVAEDGTGTVSGFAAAWPNEDVTVLGPVVARDLPTAQALITDLGTHTTGPVRYDVDAHHSALVDWLRERGLDGAFPCTQMVHTASDLPGDLDRRFAPYSVALG